MESYVYSLNGDDYCADQFDTREDALAAAVEEAKLQDLQCENGKFYVHTGVAHKVTFNRICPKAYQIIEDMSERLWDEVGDVAADYLDCLNKENESAINDELAAAIRGVFEARGINVEPNCFTVLDVKEHEIESQP